MSNNKNSFNVSQEYEIIPHQKGKAYPIGIVEWEFIKTRIRNINININIFHSIGFLLLGAGISCLITILATNFETDKSKFLTWIFFWVSMICGILSLFFGWDKHKQESAKPKDVIDQMELIESRFENQKK